MRLEHSLLSYAELYTKASPQQRILEHLAQETQLTVANPEMLTGHLAGRLLAFLVHLTGAKRILELGTFTGYSALCLAENIPSEGQVITCEANPIPLTLARKYFAISPHGHKIKILEGLALNSINTLVPGFDFVFIDAHKPEYLDYYRAIFPLVSKGGLFVFDNAFKNGEVLNPTSSGGKTIHALNQYLSQDDRVDNVLVPIRDGMNVVRKR